MQFRIYDRQTLAYKDGGYVASYTIDDDYIVNNNSTITIVKALNEKVVEGDTIVLIQTSGAYHKGTITTFDNSDFKITYKSDKELFNNNILNPLRQSFKEETEGAEMEYTAFGIQYIADIITLYFGGADDVYRRLPVKVYIDGDVLDDKGKPKMVWTWEDNQINFVDWLVDIFEKYNVVLSWDIDFDIANKLTDRKPYYIIRLSALTNSPKIIKDNVNEVMQMITYTEKQLPEATVCSIIDKETKEIVMLTEGKNLLNPNLGETNKFLGITQYGEQKTDDTSSNISGYIKVEEGKTYMFSSNDWDTKQRNVMFYDKSKNAINNKNGDGTAFGSYLISPENYNGAKISIAEETGIKYIKICYYNDAKVQLEEGEVVTGYNAYNTPAIYYLCEDKGNYYVSLKQDELTTSTKNLFNSRSAGFNSGNFTNTIVDTREELELQAQWFRSDETWGYIVIRPNNEGFFKGTITIASDATRFRIKHNGEIADIPIYIEDSQMNKIKGKTVTISGKVVKRNPTIIGGIEIKDIQLEIGDKATEYEPYYLTARVLPVKNKIVEFDTSSDSLTPEKVAKDTLIPSKFNQAIEIQLSADSKMFDFNSKFGDYYKIINKNGTIDSVYTGRKETSDDKWVKLYFGLGRQNYTDLIQMRLRKNKYKVVYGQDEKIK